jgi:hypothetical protein
MRGAERWKLALKYQARVSLRTWRVSLENESTSIPYTPIHSQVISVADPDFCRNTERSALLDRPIQQLSSVAAMQLSCSRRVRVCRGIFRRDSYAPYVADSRAYARIVDRKTVGKVDHLDGADKIKLTKQSSPDGQHHYFIPVSWIDHVDQHVHLNKTGADVTAQQRKDLDVALAGSIGGCPGLIINLPDSAGVRPETTAEAGTWLIRRIEGRVWLQSTRIHRRSSWGRCSASDGKGRRRPECRNGGIRSELAGRRDAQG